MKKYFQPELIINYNVQDVLQVSPVGSGSDIVDVGSEFSWEG
jgi:hypothetical protein